MAKDLLGYVLKLGFWIGIFCVGWGALAGGNGQGVGGWSSRLQDEGTRAPFPSRPNGSRNAARGHAARVFIRFAIIWYTASRRHFELSCNNACITYDFAGEFILWVCKHWQTTRAECIMKNAGRHCQKCKRVYGNCETQDAIPYHMLGRNVHCGIIREHYNGNCKQRNAVPYDMLRFTVWWRHLGGDRTARRKSSFCKANHIINLQIRAAARHD